MDALYSELKPDVGAVANPLFDLSEKLIRELGNFLPHAVALTETGEVRVLGAAPSASDDQATSVDVLPLLHNGLRQLARELPLKAVGVAENVTVAFQGQSPTKAVKVQFEHKRGLVVALYLPFEKKLLRGFVFGQPLTVPASPEVNVWPESAA